jgi:aspartyl-tRNA(Asn)/glutamyl-tRNA(Gln) amidotransferase subunit C
MDGREARDGINPGNVARAHDGTSSGCGAAYHAACSFTYSFLVKIPVTGPSPQNGRDASPGESLTVMASDRIDIRHVARLARLALTDDEIATFGPQLGSLMTHVDALRELDTETVAATAQVVPSRNVERPDALRPETRLTREAALKNAPQTQAGFFRVPRILAEEG